MKKNYDTVDLMKFICSILVVVIHSNPLKDICPFCNTMICQGIARLSVPLFFLSTSFFLFKGEINEEKVKKYCTRLFKLYIFWFLITLPMTIYNRFVLSKYSFFVSLFRFIKSFFFTSTFSGSWFLTASIFNTLLFYRLEYLEEKKRKKIIVVLSLISYFLCVFTSAYGKLVIIFNLTKVYDFIEMFFANPYTSILVGIPYFAMGKYVAKHEDHLKVSLFSLSIFFIFFIIEIYLTNLFDLVYTTDCYALLLPTSLLIFILVIKSKAKIKHHYIMRCGSTIIFFIHFIILFLLDVFEYLNGAALAYLTKFIITISFSLIFVVLFLSLSKNKYLSWLKQLY